MWNLQDLQDHLQEEYGYDVWETDLVEKIKNVNGNHWRQHEVIKKKTSPAALKACAA